MPSVLDIDVKTEDDEQLDSQPFKFFDSPVPFERIKSLEERERPVHCILVEEDKERPSHCSILSEEETEKPSHCIRFGSTSSGDDYSNAVEQLSRDQQKAFDEAATCSASAVGTQATGSSTVSSMLNMQCRRKPHMRSIPSKESESDVKQIGSRQTITAMERRRCERRLRDERRIFIAHFAADAIDLIVKVVFFAQSWNDIDLRYLQQIFIIVFAVAIAFTLLANVFRIRSMLELVFVVKNGFSNKWKDAFIPSGSYGQDPRLLNDAKMRHILRVKLRTLQAFAVDGPWFLINYVLFLHMNLENKRDTFALLRLTSMSFAGFGLGMKFTFITEFFKLKYMATEELPRKIMRVLPADVQCAAAASTKPNTLAAMEEAALHILSQCGIPSFVVVTMTSNHDHELGLSRFRELFPGVQYSGCTTCQGVLCNGLSQREGSTCVGLWAICDPEGVYESCSFDLGAVPSVKAATTLQEAVQRATSRVKATASEGGRYRHRKYRQPSFIFVTPSPGQEDGILEGMSTIFGKSVPLVGGTSADNEAMGKWKQWSSENGGTITQTGCSFTVCFCSAVVKAAMFTGYSPSPKQGKITKIAGPRHILEIDHKPAALVYNEWTGGLMTKQLELDQADILSDCSLYPLGHNVGRGVDKFPYYRVLHPHLLIKKDRSLTLFADVREGLQVTMMSGTTDNLVYRISQISSHAMSSSRISTAEVRGALIIFCAGCMMAASDKMHIAARQLRKTLGGVPHMGLHTFGESGSFPDGTSRHGNLMFSSIVFSSIRRVMKVMNVDTGETVQEGTEAWKLLMDKGDLDDVLFHEHQQSNA